MSPVTDVIPTRLVRHEIEAIRGNWFWFVLLGAGLILLGTVAVGSPVIASLATTTVLGSLILVSGVFEVVAAFWCRDWSGMLIVLLSGILAVVVGFMLLSNPIEGTVMLSVLLASFLFVSGLFKAAAAASYRHGAWAWMLLSGVIDVVLAVLIWRGLPGTGLAIIGLLVGINFIFRGVTWVMIGLRIRRLPRGAEIKAQYPGV